MENINSKTLCITLDRPEDLPLVEDIFQDNGYNGNSTWNADKRAYATCVVSYPTTHVNDYKEYDLYTVAAVSYDKKITSSEFIRTYARNQDSE